MTARSRDALEALITEAKEACREGEESLAGAQEAIGGFANDVSGILDGARSLGMRLLALPEHAELSESATRLTERLGDLAAKMRAFAREEGEPPPTLPPAAACSCGVAATGAMVIGGGTVLYCETCAPRAPRDEPPPTLPDRGRKP